MFFAFLFHTHTTYPCEKNIVQEKTGIQKAKFAIEKDV